MSSITSRAMLAVGGPILLFSAHLAGPRATLAEDEAGTVARVAVACAVTGKMADGVAANGKELYTKKCQSCHGATGDGQGVASKRLKVKPAAWDAARWAKTTDVEKFKSTKCGGEEIGMSDAMPDYPDYSDQQIWDMLAYSATLVKK
jgi:mono/diheme cytochrome c family protein